MPDVQQILGFVALKQRFWSAAFECGTQSRIKTGTWKHPEK
jgi:hypothetical protein